MTIRTKDQLAVMLKFIEVNKINLTRKNITTRNKIWHTIADKLNSMLGAVRDVDGWKRTYYAWRTNAGSGYPQLVQKIIKQVPDDDYFFINLSDEDLIESDNDTTEASAISSMEKQRMRLHVLILENREILQSNAKDDPLKQRIWLNIAQDLNAMPNALKLSAKDWIKRVDLSKYAVRRGRKPLKKAPCNKQHDDFRQQTDTPPTTTEDTEIYSESVRLNVIDWESRELHDSYESVEELIEFDESVPQATSNCQNIHNVNEVPSEDACEHSGEDGEIEMLFSEDDTTNEEFELLNDIDIKDDFDQVKERVSEPQLKRLKLSPMVKTFKSSQRMNKAVGKLSNDVADMKTKLKKTANTLDCLVILMQKQCRKQDETNALLEQQTQLMRLLVGYQSIKQTK